MNNESILEKYGENLTLVKYITNPAIARDKELKELVMVLLTPEKSACLVGKPGIGKTAIVEGLAYRMQMNDMPNALKGYSVYKISTPSLIGTTDGENKVVALVNELKGMDKVIIDALLRSFQKINISEYTAHSEFILIFKIASVTPFQYQNGKRIFPFFDHRRNIKFRQRMRHLAISDIFSVQPDIKT